MAFNKEEGGMEEMNSEFYDELESLINKHSMENGSDTPDFILARYLCSCLATFDAATKVRSGWYSSTSTEDDD